MLTRLKIIYTGTGLIFFLLVSCTYSEQKTPTPTSEPGLTQVYKTVYARATQSAQGQATSRPTATQTAAATLSPTASPTSRATTSPVPEPVVTLTAPVVNLCDRASPGIPFDVSIEDDTQMLPGERFTKTWRLINAGSCSWSHQYEVVWFSGARLGDVREASMPEEIKPGESIDISIDMVAPEEPGTHQSNWKLQNAAGIRFGIGPSGDAPFWVRILVVKPTDTPAPPTEIPIPTPTETQTAVLETPTETPSPTPTPMVFITSTIVLAAGDFLDLDNGANMNIAGVDLSYTTGEENNHWLTPQEAATLGMYGLSQPELSACLNTNTGTAPIAIESLTPGMFLCYRTGEGRTGWLKFNQLDPSVFSITIDLLTWASP